MEREETASPQALFLDKTYRIGIGPLYGLDPLPSMWFAQVHEILFYQTFCKIRSACHRFVKKEPEAINIIRLREKYEN
jgi:hypothetical protein